MNHKERTVHNSESIGRILDILRILQEETDEYTTISQPEILELMKNPCAERTLIDYLDAMMGALNPEDEDGEIDESVTISDYKIIPKGLEQKLHDRDIGLKWEGAKKLQKRGGPL